MPRGKGYRYVGIGYDWLANSSFHENYVFTARQTKEVVRRLFTLKRGVPPDAILELSEEKYQDILKESEEE